MSSNARRKGSPDTRSSIKGVTTFRNAKTRVFVFLTLVILTAVFSANALTANATAATTDTAVTQESGFIASSFNNILSYFGFATPAAERTNGCDTAPEGLIACYRGDNDTTDAKGVHNGEWVGTYGYATGKVGAGAFNFSGKGTVEVIDSVDLNPSNITVDGWVNLVSTEGDFTLISKGDAYSLRVRNGQVVFASRNAEGVIESLEGRGTIGSGKWVHIAATNDGAFSRLYIDGEDAGSIVSKGLVKAEGANLVIGSVVSNENGFTASADEVKVFGRALTAKEIREIAGNRPNAIENVTVSILPGSLTEGNAGTQIATISVTRDAVNNTDDISFVFSATGATTGATCAPGVDYLITPNSVTFISGQVGTQTIPVTVCGDTLVEGDEVLSITAMITRVGVGLDDTVTGLPLAFTITDDDRVTVAASANVNEGTPGAAGAITYTIGRGDATGNTGPAFVVPFQMGGDAVAAIFTATADIDYNLAAGGTCGAASVAWTNQALGQGTLTFPAASTLSSCTVVINAVADDIVETNNNARLTVNAPIGTPSTAQAAFNNDDNAWVRVEVVGTGTSTTPVAGSQFVEEGTPLTLTGGALAYTITRGLCMASVIGTPDTTSCPGGETAGLVAQSVTYTSNTGTATGPPDFTSPSGTEAFTAAQVTRSFNINPTDDTTVEPDETIIVALTGGGAGTYNIDTPSSATGFVNDDDETVSVAVAGSPVAENAGPAALSFTVTRTSDSVSGANNLQTPPAVNPIGDPIVVAFTLGGAATAALCDGTDYTVSAGAGTVAVSFVPGTCSGTVTIAALDVDGIVLVTPVNDAIPENQENVLFTLTPVADPGTAGYSVAAAGNTANGVITNDDFVVFITGAVPLSTLEDGPTNLVYTFTRVGGNAALITANFNATGTAQAVAPVDYAVTFNVAGTFVPTGGTSPGTIQIGAADNTTVGGVAANNLSMLTADPTADPTVELDEDVKIIVSTVPGVYTAGVLGPVDATGVILNDDAEVSVAVSPTAVNEDSGTNLVYTFTRTGGCGAALTINYTTSGSAVAADYTGTVVGANTATFAAGQCITAVNVVVIADGMVEPDETVILTITASTGAPNQYTIAAPPANAATGTITNDDAGVSVAVLPASVAEGNAGAGTPLVYTFTRTGVTNTPLTVNYTILGTATNGIDYTAIGTSVPFGVGQTMAMVNVIPTGDLMVEADETVIITVVNGTGYSAVAPTSATGTITNDDTDITCTGPVPASVNENSGTAMVYTCMRTGVTATAASIPFTLGGSATFGASPNDYTVAGNTSGVTAAGGTLNFAATVTSAMVNVTPVADTTVESNETVDVGFTTGAGFNIVGSPVLLSGTITNDDTDVSLAVSLTNPVGAGSSVTENGTVNLLYTFTRTTSPALLALPLTVNFSTMGTANNPPDFTQTSTGTITFAAGSPTATMTVDPTGDTTVEPDETVIITVTTGTGYNAGATATGTITNDDTTYRIVATGSPTTEGNGPAPTTAVFTVFRDGANSPAGQVDISSIPGSGTAIAGPQNTVCLLGQDYTTDGTTIMFAAGGDTSQTFTFNICGDLVFELPETFDAQLTNPVGGNIATQVATMTILDNDAAPVLTINDQPTINENAGTATFTVTQSVATGLNTTVSFATGAMGDTATAGQDYSASMGTVTIPAGSTTGTLTVPITDDTIDEPNETFTVTLSMPVNATIGTTPPAGDGIGIGTIIDNEPTTTFAIGDVSQAEGNDSANPGIPTTSSFNFQLLRTGDAQGTETVCFATEDGDGSIPGPGPNPATGALVFVAGVDYTSRPAGPVNCVNFTQGGPSAITIPVIVFGDNNFEFDESFTVRLLTINTVAGGARFTDATGLGTILNDDLVSLFTIAQTMPANPVPEGNSGTTLVTYTVTRTTTAVQSTVQYATAPGTTNPATSSAAGSGCGTLNSGPDYVNTSGTLTFPIGTASLTFTVAICGDTADELNETFTASLSNPTFAALGSPSSVTTTIGDDDAAPIISVSDVTVCEVDTGTQAMVFTITRTGLSNLTSTVTVSTVNGSAVAPGDYVAISGLVVTFNPGETTKTVTVTINGDVIFETDETFTLQVTATSTDVVSDPPNGGDPIGLGIIQNNCVGGDPAPTFAIDNVIRPEGNVDPLNPGATTPFSFRITRTGATELPSNVSFATADPLNQAVGGAACTAGVDYISQTGTVTFTAAGLNFRDVVIQVCPDGNFEQNETFFVDISNATNGTIPAIGARGTGTIGNDDGLNFTVDHVTGNEGNNPASTTSFVFRINKNGTTALSATVNYATLASATNPATGGAACGAGIDYVSTSGTATFAAAVTFVDITVPVCGDVVGELDEQFLFRISAPSLGTVQASDGIGTILNDDGPVITPTGIEGDVVDAAGGPAGDNAVLANDVTAIRQMVLGNLALPGAGAQFQRTDVNIPCGNGQIDAGDVTVIRNFALGNPTPPAVCGPTAPVGTIEMSRGFGPDSPEVVGRIIRAIGSTTSPGQTVVVPIELNSQGDETSASYTVNFNSSVLTFVSAALGPGVPAGADIGTNTSQAAMGRVGVLVSSTNTYALGPRQMALLTFTVAAGAAAGMYPVTFSSTPTGQFVASTTGAALPTTYEAGTIVIGPTAAGVRISGRVTSAGGQGLRNATVIITDSEGNRRTATTGSFGIYTFEDVEAGQTYALGVQARRYRFASRVVNVTDSLTDVNFVGQE